MIKVYSRKLKGDESFEKVERWLKNHHLRYKVYSPQNITEQQINQMLKVSELGFEEILISKQRGIKSWSVLGVSNAEISNLSTIEFAKLIASKTFLLKTPIVFDDKRLMAGYNADEIRCFLTRSYRTQEMKNLNCK